MGLPTLTLEKWTLKDLQDEHNHTLPRVKVYAPAYLAGFEAFQEDLDESARVERKLRQEIEQCKLLRVLIDRSLNGLATRVAEHIPKQREHPPEVLRERYFDDESTSRFTRPTLSGQLKAQRGSIPSLEASGDAEFKQVGLELKGVVQEADKADEALRQAEVALEDFLRIGGRKALYDKYNTLREQLYDGVGDEALAEELFLHYGTREEQSLEVALRETRAKIEKRKAQLKQEQKKLAALEAKKDAEDAEAAERAKAAEELRALKEQKAALAKREAELKAKASKKAKK